MDFLPLFLWGLLGGVLAEFVAIAAHRNKREFPKYVRRVRYWVFGLCWIVAGGFAAYLTLEGASDLRAFVPVQAGATAPLFLERLLAATNDPSVGSVA